MNELIVLCECLQEFTSVKCCCCFCTKAYLNPSKPASPEKKFRRDYINFFNFISSLFHFFLLFFPNIHSDYGHLPHLNMGENCGKLWPKGLGLISYVLVQKVLFIFIIPFINF